MLNQSDTKFELACSRFDLDRAQSALCSAVMRWRDAWHAGETDLKPLVAVVDDRAAEVRRLARAVVALAGAQN
jgi:hypothetical protein